MDPPQPLPTRPYASWVMGRSARWHDPAFLAELSEAERAGTAGARPGAVGGGLSAVELVSSGPVDALTAVDAAVRLVRWTGRLVRVARRARAHPDRRRRG
jgi:hypothetical protein